MLADERGDAGDALVGLRHGAGEAVPHVDEILALVHRDVDTSGASIINTSSGSGLYGNPGQLNYGAAKAGIAAMTNIAAKELGRYGVTANAIAPAALTRMTENLGFGQAARDVKPGTFDAYAPENISPLVVWLGSTESANVTGQVFNVAGGRISVVEGWRRGPERDKGDRWTPAELGPVVSRELLQQTRPPETLGV